MLDMIVLGVVPGTHFIITLWWAVTFSLIFLLLVLIYTELHAPTKTTKRVRPTVDFDSIDSGTLLHPNFILPGRSTWIDKYHD